MLSIRELLSSTTQHSLRCIRSRVVSCNPLNLSKAQLVDQRYAHTVPQEYIVDEEDAKKYGLPPKLKSLEKNLLYSDFVDGKKLTSGYRNNKITINRLKNKARDKRNVDAMAPVYSTMLKHLSDVKEKIVEPESQIEEEEMENVEKPVHMPYAATDPYRTIPAASEPELEFRLPDLNEKYKLMYEKHLQAKKLKKPAESQAEILEDDEESGERFIIEHGSERPIDSAKKVPPDWMADYEQFSDHLQNDDAWKSNYGTPDPEEPVSSTPCGGCGALLHCKDPAIPGYLPSELFRNHKPAVLRTSVCQRCHFMKHYNTTLEVKVAPEEYPALLSHIKKKKVAVILMVDLTDFPCSIWPGILDIIGKTTNVFVVGNKVDLLPNDGINFLKNVKNSLIQSLQEMGIAKANIKSVNLISAKTGYGVEELINTLYKNWEYKGDVYMIGCTNVGKSSLFNALLGSDYCKIQAADLIQRATISPWPGTTLNLLKFPIMSPVRWRLFVRVQRLLAERESRQYDEKSRIDKLKVYKNIKFATLQGHIGKTFAGQLRKEGTGFFGTDTNINPSGHFGFNETKSIYKNSRWCFDTPGTIHPDQVLHLLTTEELMLTLPQEIIKPRTFDLGFGCTLFLAGLGRLDFVDGAAYVKCTVFASKNLPVTICKTTVADEMYKELLHTEAFVVPINDPKRLEIFPALQSKEFQVTGIDVRTSAADIVLSSAGWVAVTPPEGREVDFRAWTPEGRGIYLRTPAMLSRSVNYRGFKKPFSPAYTLGRQVYVK